MRTKIISMGLLFLTGCLGYSSKDNEVIGQIKKVTNKTPIVCPNYVAIDLSLGVIRNGNGSMSHEDQWFYAPDYFLKQLKEFSEKGAIVKITYDVARFTLCTPDLWLKDIEISNGQ
jgi:hypothetical protein